MNHSQNFDEQNLDELIVGFKGGTLSEEGWWKNFDKLLVIRFIKVFHCQTFVLASYGYHAVLTI